MSIGGGGGQVAGAVSVGSSGNTLNIGGNLGGRDTAAADNGGTVTVDNLRSAAIATKGVQAVAIFAQSVGGGGGTGGTVGNLLKATTLEVGGVGGATGKGGAVNVTNLAALRTGGNDTAAIIAQSVGGGGGYTGMVGPTGVLGGDDQLRLWRHGQADERRRDHDDWANSDGIIAQSVGGGGGIAGGVKSLGGVAGNGGPGGDVKIVTNNAAIVTSGAGAIGPPRAVCRRRRRHRPVRG